MDVLDIEALRERAVLEWGLGDEPQLEAVQALIVGSFERMRRVYDILRLTRDDAGVRNWFHAPLQAGRAPLAFFGEGEGGLRVAEDALIAEFQRAAPREIFASSAFRQEPAREAHVLSRLIFERAAAEDVRVCRVYDPLRSGRPAVFGAASRIARAVARVADLWDGNEVRVLVDVACLDPDLAIRTAAAQAAARLVGFPDMADALSALRDDADAGLREFALGALTRFARGEPELHRRILPFTLDPDARVRAAAFRFLAGEPRLAPKLRESLVARIWDPAPSLQAEARAVFAAEIPAAAQALAREVASGASLSPYLTLAAAKEPALSDADRTKAFCARLDALACDAARASELSETASALRRWAGLLPPAIVERLTGLVRAGTPLDEALTRLAASRPVEEIWDVLLAVLALPVPERVRSLRTGLAEAAAHGARTSRGRQDDLVRLLAAVSLPEEARANLAWSLSELQGVRSPAPRALAALLEEPKIPVRLARAALSALRNLADPLRVDAALVEAEGRTMAQAEKDRVLSAAEARATLKAAAARLEGEAQGIATRFLEEIADAEAAAKRDADPAVRSASERRRLRRTRAKARAAARESAPQSGPRRDD